MQTNLVIPLLKTFFNSVSHSFLPALPLHNFLISSCSFPFPSPLLPILLSHPSSHFFTSLTFSFVPPRALLPSLARRRRSLGKVVVFFGSKDSSFGPFKAFTVHFSKYTFGNVATVDERGITKVLRNSKISTYYFVEFFQHNASDILALYYIITLVISFNFFLHLLISFDIVPPHLLRQDVYAVSNIRDLICSGRTNRKAPRFRSESSIVISPRLSIAHNTTEVNFPSMVVRVIGSRTFTLSHHVDDVSSFTFSLLSPSRGPPSSPLLCQAH